MRKLFTKLWQGAVAALVGASLFGLIGGPALALTNPPTFAPRMFPDQVVHYERHVVNIATGSATIDGQVPCVTTVNGTTSADCNAKIGAVPYNALLVRAEIVVTTGCNTGGTGPTCVLNIGTASGGAQIVSAQTIAATTAFTALGASFVGGGIAVTGNNITPTGANGGFDLWLNVHQAATAIVQASAGTFVIVIEYIAPNDGGCINVPLATPSPAC